MESLGIAFVLACTIAPLIGIVTAIVYHIGSALWRRDVTVAITVQGGQDVWK